MKLEKVYYKKYWKYKYRDEDEMNEHMEVMKKSGFNIHKINIDKKSITFNSLYQKDERGDNYD